MEPFSCTWSQVFWGGDWVGGEGLENFLFFKLKDEQWKDLTEYVGRAENWLYRQNILEWEGS